jgi:SAM-dependent methyltransferase
MTQLPCKWPPRPAFHSTLVVQLTHHRASTRSLYAQDLDYVEENGRRYCGSYYMPNDDKEQDRLRLVHQVYLHVFDCQLTSVPLNDPEEILDIGTGTGEWAIGMADQYPNCKVTGIDISAIQPTAVPENVYFEVDNAELEWDRGEDTFDLIHMRNLTGSFQDWKFIYDQAFTHLKPGGWVEILDFDDQEGFKKLLTVFPPESALHIMARDLFIASMKSGRPRGTAHLDPMMLLQAGFVDIKTTEYVIPIAPQGNFREKAGKIWLAACLTGLEALCLRLLTKYMGWDPEVVKRTCENGANEMKWFAFDKEKPKGLVIKVRRLVGRKPGLPEDWMPPPPSLSENEMRDDTMSDETDATPMSLGVDDPMHKLHGPPPTIIISGEEVHKMEHA